MGLLVADVGGTNTRVGWSPAPGAPVERVEVRDTAAAGSLDALLADWVAGGHPAPAAVVAAVAGPVDGAVARLTNAAWDADLRRLPVPGLLLNDLAALAAALPVLGAGGQVSLRAGPVAPGPQVVLGIGTGLGECIVHNGIVLPGEGGHKVFGPPDARGRAFAAHLAVRLGRPPSWEDVLSGSGLGRLAQFVSLEHGPSPLASAVWAGSPEDAAARTTAAAASGDPLALAVCAAFAAWAACEVRNLSLQVLAGGAWIGGGVAPRIPIPVWKAAFGEAAHLGGPLDARAAAVPVALITHATPALLGAAAAGWARFG